MKREDMLARVRERKAPWDILVVGGGATGAGVALDAASRGYSVLNLKLGTENRLSELCDGMAGRTVTGVTDRRDPTFQNT